jgi:hypothetical protein
VEERKEGDGLGRAQAGRVLREKSRREVGWRGLSAQEVFIRLAFEFEFKFHSIDSKQIGNHSNEIQSTIPNKVHCN